MQPSEHRTWLSSVAFLDVVGFSKRSIKEQLEIKQHLDSVLREQLDGIPRDDFILLDRGDGAAVCFLVEPESAFFFAIHVRDALAMRRAQRPPYEIRVGINLGPIKIIRDVNGDRAPVGEGINCAARVMDFAGPNEVLVARSFYDVIGCQSDEYAALFSYLGIRADKHVREFELYEVVAPGTPHAVRATGAVPLTVPIGGDLDRAYLERVRRALALAIGPMADLFLSRAVQRSSDRQHLLACLGTALHDREQRDAFFEQLGTKAPPDEHESGGPCPPPPLLHTSGAGVEMGVDALAEHARRILARHLGPIAALLVRQAAAEVADGAALVTRVAEKLTDPRVREAFLAEIRSLLQAEDR